MNISFEEVDHILFVFVLLRLIKVNNCRVEYMSFIHHIFCGKLYTESVQPWILILFVCYISCCYPHPLAKGVICVIRCIVHALI